MAMNIARRQIWRRKASQGFVTDAEGNATVSIAPYPEYPSLGLKPPFHVMPPKTLIKGKKHGRS
jgi:hypothetical protein